MPLDLNGPEIQAMTERIAAENKVTVSADTSTGLTVTAGKSWAKGAIGAFFRMKSKKDKSAGVTGEFKW